MSYISGVYAENSKGFAVNIPVVNQSQTAVTGEVYDEMGPVTGASVVIIGTTNRMVTDLDGKFAIQGAKRGDVIQISYVGYVTHGIVWDGKTSLIITLKGDSQNLDERVVAGYGVQKKESLTGAMQVVSSEQLLDATSPTVKNLLSGKVPGVQVFFKRWAVWTTRKGRYPRKVDSKQKNRPIVDSGWCYCW